ncbi:M4 family metallopeptidase [Actinocatenispora comari]|uniref:Neutral metalloproteinase n=1 Tax=Actinocatenispora comari TaxID=2807577 RepID=A0A8J4EL87_9ACTN|nr:M4 family metallopeptidase [Actinocatenispora comari]GIL27593.1 peptidase [Actinocatenispora comari]
MKRTLAAVGAAVLVAGGITAGIAATASAKPAVPTRSAAIARADDSLAAHHAAVHASTADAFKVRRVVTDPTGATHVRYTRTYHGLPVYGGDLVVHNAPGGGYAGVDVAQHATIDVSTTAKIRAAAAARTARADHDGKVTAVSDPDLVVDATRSRPELAYDVVVRGFQADKQTPSREHVLVDANTGKTIRSWEEVETVTGTGHGLYVGTVNIDTTQSGGGYQLQDPSHGNGYTCDMYGSESGSCSIFTDPDNDWGNGSQSDRASAAVDAHFGAAKTFDFYRETYGRNGIFGDGRGVPSKVHYGNGYVNAFWDGSSMTYGDGQGNQYPLIALDVAGHEMSHGVSQALADLGYSGDVGGINEANSDIFGTMVEFYANSPGDPGDFTIGEMISANFGGRPLRYMYQPSLDGSSFDCWSSAVPQSDPHYSSGVGNHLFYLLAEGSGSSQYGTSPTCNGSTVTGIGKDKAAAIWYHALDAYMISTETYKQARQDTLKAATDLYGQCSAEYQATQAAWSAVSVTGNDQPCGGQPTTSPTDTSSPTPPPNQGCGGVSAWDASTGYEPDDEVSYDGSLWKAVWWSTGAAPGEAGSWAVWQKVGDC